MTTERTGMTAAKFEEELLAELEAVRAGDGMRLGILAGAVRRLAERAGARWDPEEPALPGGAWGVDEEGDLYYLDGDGDRQYLTDAEYCAALARLVAIREAARALRTPIMVLPEASPCCINMANLRALFALLGEP